MTDADTGEVSFTDQDNGQAIFTRMPRGPRLRIFPLPVQVLGDSVSNPCLIVMDRCPENRVTAMNDMLNDEAVLNAASAAGALVFTEEVELA